MTTIFDTNMHYNILIDQDREPKQAEGLSRAEEPLTIRCIEQSLSIKSALRAVEPSLRKKIEETNKEIKALERSLAQKIREFEVQVRTR